MNKLSYGLKRQKGEFRPLLLLHILKAKKEFAPAGPVLPLQPKLLHQKFKCSSSAVFEISFKNEKSGRWRRVLSFFICCLCIEHRKYWWNIEEHKGKLITNVCATDDGGRLARNAFRLSMWSMGWKMASRCWTNGLYQQMLIGHVDTAVGL